MTRVERIRAFQRTIIEAAIERHGPYVMVTLPPSDRLQAHVRLAIRHSVRSRRGVGPLARGLIYGARVRRAWYESVRLDPPRAQNTRVLP